MIYHWEPFYLMTSQSTIVVVSIWLVCCAIGGAVRRNTAVSERAIGSVEAMHRLMELRCAAPTLKRKSGDS